MEGEVQRMREGGNGEKEREKEGEREMNNMVIEFISLLLTMAAFQIKFL